MSAIVDIHPGRPRKLAILWIAPLQAASLFTVWAIAAGGEILRSWLLTATMCLMTLPLLVGLEGSLLAMMLFEPLRGLLRRAQYLIVGYSAQDPIHLLTPVVTFIALIVLLRKERLSIFWATPLARPVSILALIFFLEMFNPLQGSLFVGLTGGLFMLVPIAWFYFGQTVSDKFIQRALTLVVILGILGSLYGVYQLVFGYPAFEQYWIDNTDFYSSIAVGHIRRAIATFSSAEEWGRYTEVGAIFAMGMAFGGRRLWKRGVWALAAIALLTAILLSGQRTAIFGFLIGAITLVLLGARNWRGMVTRLALLLLPFVLVSVFVSAPSDDEMWSKDESETVGTILTHTQRGTLKPAEEESLQVRLENWGNLVTSVIPTRPLGAGLGTSQLGDLRENHESDLPPVDNFILVVALACGIPGALVFIWVLSRSTWCAVRLARSPDSEANANVRRVVSAIMPALILNSIFGLTFSIYSVAPIAWLLIGWISVETQRLRAAPPREIITI
jgi:hypothetical protein